MEVLKSDFDLGDFFARLRGSNRSILCLDYDGTLAPFTEDRHKAFPYPGVSELLHRLIETERTRVVIVSGRAIDDLIPLLAIENPPEMWGSHGREVRFPNGTRQFSEPIPQQRLGLSKALELIEIEGPDDSLEKKPASIAVHVRGKRKEKAEHLLLTAHRLWEPLTQKYRLELHSFDGGMELRASGVDKGTALAHILKGEPDSISSAYLGDDLTDEDAFETMKGRGLSALVRSEFRPTAADIWLKPPEELFSFLEKWLEAVGRITP